MFWDSVFAGLRVFTYWETYVAGIEYLAIFINRLIIIGNFMEKIKSLSGFSTYETNQAACVSC